MASRLEALARETIDSSPRPTDVAALRQRSARRARRRRTRLSALVAVAVVLVLGVVGWRVVGPGDGKRPSVASRPTHPPATTTPDPAFAGLPAPGIPSDQERVPLERLRAPMVVAGGKVWVANNSGVDVFDAMTLKRLATVPTDLPVVTIAANGDDVWLVTGDDDAGDRGESAPYQLLRVDLSTAQVAFDAVLPFVDAGHRSTWNLRLAAGPDVAWVRGGQSIVKVDGSSGQITPIPFLAGGNIAADRNGLWVPGAGGMVHIDGRTNEISPVSSIPAGFMWSVAATDDAAWVIEATADRNGGAGLDLFRIDAVTHAVTTFVVPGIAVVTGDDEVWVQIYVSSRDDTGHPTGLVGHLDPATGKIDRTMHIFLGDVPGSSSDGYTFPPFAVANGQIWSAYSGLQRTSTASTPSKSTTKIDLSTTLSAINSYYDALGDHDIDGARQAIALEYRNSWAPGSMPADPDATHLKTLSQLNIKTPQRVAPPDWMATWPYSEWVGVRVTYRATYRANDVTHDGLQTRFVYLARAAGTTDWYIAHIGVAP
jgi:hypothetical protein